MRSPLAYVGGKSKVARRLIALFPPHRTYVELFAGAAHVFFQKEPSRVEVLNDIDEIVVNFLRVCQYHHEELIRYLSFTAPSRRLHETYSRQEPSDLTDIQRAARFLYLQRTSFAGRVTRQNFHVSVTQPPNFNPLTLPEVLTAAAKRLARVVLEQRPYGAVLDRFGSPETFYFIDPPYVGHKLYRYNFTDEDFVKLSERLSNVRGMFLMTINDCALSRRLFGHFHIQEHSFAYTCARTVPTVRELLVANYPFTINGLH